VIIRPTAAFMLGHPARFIALGFGTGLAPAAPGTAGTLLGFPLYLLLARWLSVPALFGAIVAGFLLGVWACGRTGRDLGIADHGAMVWDEIIAFMLVLMLTPGGIFWQAFAFFSFRAFDVLKPPPIRHIDRTMKGGFGVMFDDIVAAFYTLLLMAAVKLLFF